MMGFFQANLNAEGSGAVCAAPEESPEGDFYWHWMRDGGLAMKAWMELNGNNISLIRTELDSYVDWVGMVQFQVDLRRESQHHWMSSERDLC